MFCWRARFYPRIQNLLCLKFHPDGRQNALQHPPPKKKTRRGRVRFHDESERYKLMFSQCLTVCCRLADQNSGSPCL